MLDMNETLSMERKESVFSAGEFISEMRAAAEDSSKGKDWALLNFLPGLIMELESGTKMSEEDGCKILDELKTYAPKVSKSTNTQETIMEVASGMLTETIWLLEERFHAKEE